MTTLLLIRHGDNDCLKKGLLPGTMPGVHLNEHGLLQARTLAKSLARLPIKAIYASPLERAIESAQPLAEILHLEIEVRAALSDPDVGEWTGRKIKDLRTLPEWVSIQEQPSRAGFPGGETYPDVQARLIGEIEAILAFHQRRHCVAVFFHADPIKLVLAHYLGIPLDNFQRLIIDPASLSLLSINRQGVRLAGMNLKAPFPQLTA